MRYNAAYAAYGISGESTPSQADIKVTRDLIRAGQLLKLELLDHVVIGHGNFSSLRALG
jgi:DNA repair protein RadC